MIQVLLFEHGLLFFQSPQNMGYYQAWVTTHGNTVDICLEGDGVIALKLLWSLICHVIQQILYVVFCAFYKGNR